MVEPQSTPSRTDGSETLSVATWNIRSGRNGGLESACRALDSLGVDVAVLQETKLTGGIYTRLSSGYSIVATDAPSSHQGGIALAWKDDGDAFEVEATRIWHPHVLSFQLVTGRDRFFVVGCYMPPGDLEAFEAVKMAWLACPRGCKPLLIGDLNIDLDSPRDDREDTIAEECDAMDLTEMSQHFCQPRKGLARGRWSWRMQRRRRWVSSRPDYFLAQENSRRCFRRVVLKMPRHHDSDHRAVIASIYGGPLRRIKAYRRRRSRFPIRLPFFGPRTQD